MDRMQIEKRIRAMIQASPFGGIPLEAVTLAREQLGLSTWEAMMFAKTILDAQPAEWRAAAETRESERLLQQFRDELEERLGGLAREFGWRPAIRELSVTDASAWINQLRERFALPRDLGLWQALWQHPLAHEAAMFHEEVPADDPAAGEHRSYRPQLTGTFADYRRCHDLPPGGITRVVYELGLRCPHDQPWVVEMSADDAARCVHAIYTVMVSDVLVVDRDLRWIVCVIHHGTTRLIRTPGTG